MATQHILARIRTKLGFSTAEVAAAGGWSRKDFGDLERLGELDVEDALRLTDLYGVDVGGIVAGGKIRSRDFPVAALLKGNAEILTADTRFAMTEAMSVARDVREVQQVLGIEPGFPVTGFLEDDDLAHPDSGNVRRLAAAVRDRLSLDGPIPSVVDDVCEHLGILVFACSFSDKMLDAFSTWSVETGPLVVVNTDSPRASGPLGLRATLAHEVCHLLFDRNKMRQIDTFCEVERPTQVQFSEFDKRERVEQRARAFQAELLAPQTDLVRAQRVLAHLPPDGQLAELCRTWGLGPVAVAWQVLNADGADLRDATVAAVEDGTFTEWDAVRTPSKPLAVPALRRRTLLPLVKHGVQQGEISVSWARELLRIGVEDFDGVAAAWMS